jgi:hypothetical protein
MTEQSPSAEKVRWGVLRLLSGDLASDDEKIDAELDLDDFQFWFQDNPKHTGFKQILINLSGGQWGELKELPLVEERSPQPPSIGDDMTVRTALASTGERPEGPQPVAVEDYTERALTVARDAIEGVPSHLLPYRINSEEIAQAIAPHIADALSERDAAAIRAWGKRVWSDTEEVAYQAGVNDTRARLQDPAAELIAAGKQAIAAYYPPAAAHHYLDGVVRAALTKIAEMLK